VRFTQECMPCLAAMQQISVVVFLPSPANDRRWLGHGLTLLLMCSIEVSRAAAVALKWKCSPAG
jgi:hypothetical protein